MKWIGQHIWDFISRFRTTVYLENLETSSDENVLVVDSDGKVTKNTSLGGADLTYNGSTANGVLTYGSASTIDVESNLTYNSDELTHNGDFTIASQVLTLNIVEDIEINADTGNINFKDNTVTLAAISNIGSATVTGGQIAVNRKFAVTSTTVGDYDGDVVYFGSGSSNVLGEIVHYKSDGTWEAADANTAANCDGLLGVALGTTPATHGVLLRGMVTIGDIDGTEAVGDVLFLSEDATGHANCVAPSANPDIVRIIGYCLHATNKTIWFNPDNTFIEIA